MGEEGETKPKSKTMGKIYIYVKEGPMFINKTL